MIEQRYMQFQSFFTSNRRELKEKLRRIGPFAVPLKNFAHVAESLGKKLEDLNADDIKSWFLSSDWVGLIEDCIFQETKETVTDEQRREWKSNLRLAWVHGSAMTADPPPIKA